MQRLQAFKFELRPNGKQQRDMRRFAGACRFVYNKALALQKAHYEAGGKFIGYVAMPKHLTEWRSGAETPWLKDAPVHPLQHALKDMEQAYKNFFAKRAAFPKFKKRGQHDSFRYPDPKQFKLERAHLPAQAGLDASAPVAPGHGRIAQCQHQLVGQQMVRLHPDRARGGAAGAASDERGWYRHRHCPFRYDERWQLPRTAQQLQET